MASATDRCNEIVGRARDAGYDVSSATVGDFTDVAVTYRSDFRWTWLATRMHTFTFVAALDGADPDTLATYANACVDHARKSKPGLPRGFQTGSAAVTIAVMDGPSDDVRSWASAAPKRRFAIMTFPAVVDATTGATSTVEKHLVWGAIYDGHFRRVLADHLGGADVAPEPASARRVKLGYAAFVLVSFLLPVLIVVWLASLR